MFLLDTDVLIDCLRGMPSARQWLSNVATQAFGVPGVVAMELLMGCRDQADQRQVQKFITRFQIFWPDASEFARAYELGQSHRGVFTAANLRWCKCSAASRPARPPPSLIP